MDLFRGVLRLGEYSERTLDLTLDVIDENPANYTAWAFRRRALEALNANLYDELAYTERMAIAHPKNYQIWHHRREICTLLQDGSAEKAFSAKALAGDAKNYHAWAHRQWALRTFDLWDGELAFVDDLLRDDVRNNSAWNQRWFVLSHTTALTADDRERELAYALEKAATTVHNESPWNYIRALVRGHEAQFAAALKRELLALLDAHPDCVFVAALLVDLYATEQTSDAIAAAHEVRSPLGMEGGVGGRLLSLYVDVDVQLTDKLMNETDRVRKAYWRFRKDALQVAA